MCAGGTPHPRHARVSRSGSANGFEALAVEQQFLGPIHLLVTDTVMPVINGTELARQMAQRRSGIKVLFTSGYADDPVQQVCEETPSTAFLQKPFTPGSLATKVREVLASSPTT